MTDRYEQAAREHWARIRKTLRPFPYPEWVTEKQAAEPLPLWEVFAVKDILKIHAKSKYEAERIAAAQLNLPLYKVSAVQA